MVTAQATPSIAAPTAPIAARNAITVPCAGRPMAAALDSPDDFRVLLARRTGSDRSRTSGSRLSQPAHPAVPPVRAVAVGHFGVIGAPQAKMGDRGLGALVGRQDLQAGEEPLDVGPRPRVDALRLRV